MRNVEPEFDPSPDAPEQPTPDWMYDYLRRDQGATSTGSYRYWATVLTDPARAALWNRMTRDFKRELNVMQRDWLYAHYTLLIDETCTGRDRDFLRYKLVAHFVRSSKGQVSNG